MNVSLCHVHPTRRLDLNCELQAAGPDPLLPLNHIPVHWRRSECELAGEFADDSDYAGAPTVRRSRRTPRAARQRTVPAGAGGNGEPADAPNSATGPADLPQLPASAWG